VALHEFTKSVDGFEKQFATNHLGHFLLTKLLMPYLVPGGRVVNVSSAGHVLGQVRFEDVNFEDGSKYNEWFAYAQAKCANVLFSKGLAKRVRLFSLHPSAARSLLIDQQGILSFSLHPGNIFETSLGANLVDPDWPFVMGLFTKAGFEPPGLKTLSEGTATIMTACLDTRLEKVNGAYLDDSNVGRVSAFVEEEGNTEKLWEASEKMVGEKFVI